MGVLCVYCDCVVVVVVVAVVVVVEAEVVVVFVSDAMVVGVSPSELSSHELSEHS